MAGKGRPFDGLLNLNKPSGITSARALDRVRRITNVRKSGHSGTLDPMASGVLVICMGRGTKLTERLMDQPKVYAATARLDVTSDTFDADAEVRAVPVAEPPDEHTLGAALREFEGRVEQVPPIFSAIKIGGRPAYKLARENVPVRLEARVVSVYWLCLSRYEWPEVDFELCCGRGTYVRSIVRDLGERLGTGGCLTRLERRAVGPCHVTGAITLEKLRDTPLETAAIDLQTARKLLDAPPVIPPRPQTT
ncbi:MAG: tRNA pseudouridine(55) synthase TruB [Phycisphaerae bacterium]|nr:tRNA pseudouridine(55) synthase TruB [Phycisphaerae bacterium]